MTQIKLGRFKCFAIGSPSDKEAYLSFVTEDGQSYRIEFASKQQLSLICFQASKIADKWDDD